MIQLNECSVGSALMTQSFHIAYFPFLPRALPIIEPKAEAEGQKAVFCFSKDLITVVFND
jgi:hypothetical protein